MKGVLLIGYHDTQCNSALRFAAGRDPTREAFGRRRPFRDPPALPGDPGPSIDIIGGAGNRLASGGLCLPTAVSTAGPFHRRYGSAQRPRTPAFVQQLKPQADVVGEGLAAIRYLPGNGCNYVRTRKGKYPLLPPQYIGAPGACGKTRVVVQSFQAKPERTETTEWRMAEHAVVIAGGGPTGAQELR